MSHRRIASTRAAIAFAHDAVMAPVSFLIALALRLGADVWPYVAETDMLLALGVFTVVCAGVFWFMDLYRGIWRYASMPDLTAIVRAVTIALLVFLAITFLITRLEALPRSFLIINWFVLIFLLGAPRLLYRVFKDRGFDHVMERTVYRVPVLLIGAGDAAELFIRDLRRTRESAYEPVGILDDKGTRVGRQIHGVPVMGDLSRLDAAVGELRARGKAPQRVIVTRPVPPETMRELLAAAEANGMTLARLPKLTDFRSGAGDPSERRIELRPVAIEDLLGRPQVRLDRAAMARLVAGKRVAVTGAGGSIGSELVRQIADFGPARLILVDHAEVALYTVSQELTEHAPHLSQRAVLADVRDRAGVMRLFGDERPELVFHAAALKHVPLAEDNPAEAVLTNVVGTRNLAEACRGHGVQAMVQVSTDKAVNPTGIMGATKHLAERYCQALDLGERGAAAHGDARDDAEPGTRFVTVRFGNVLGSTGSVVPLFQRQIARGGPVTVTHPDATRYFMTVHEAVQLVLQASALGLNGASADDVGRIYVLDMGEPVRIADLARQVIRLAGMSPDKDVEIVHTGLRPGEKLHEELFQPGERNLPTRHPALRLAAAQPGDLAVLEKGLDELARQARTGRVDEMCTTLRRLVPSYQAPETEPAPAAAS